MKVLSLLSELSRDEMMRPRDKSQRLGKNQTKTADSGTNKTLGLSSSMDNCESCLGREAESSRAPSVTWAPELGSSRQPKRATPQRVILYDKEN